MVKWNQCNALALRCASHYGRGGHLHQQWAELQQVAWNFFFSPSVPFHVDCCLYIRNVSPLSSLFILILSGFTACVLATFLHNAVEVCRGVLCCMYQAQCRDVQHLKQLFSVHLARSLGSISSLVSFYFLFQEKEANEWRNLATVQPQKGQRV